jgi:hypothetical protein
VCFKPAGIASAAQGDLLLLFRRNHPPRRRARRRPQRSLQAVLSPKTDEWQLFDLEKDSQEMKSVHDDPAYADILAEMKSTYQKLRADYKVR